MNLIPMHADVWVIEQEHVFLFRQKSQQWVEEHQLPYDEFSGSAIALSSCSLTDTVVYLNVFQQTSTGKFWSENRWAGIAEDPLRIVDSTATAFHQQVLTELNSMGKTVRVIAAPKPSQFNHGTEMALLDRQELKLLKSFTDASKTGKGHFRSKLLLYFGLWMKPGRNYQAIRAVTLACTVCTVLVMNWHTQQQQAKYEKISLQRFQNSVSAATRDVKAVPFVDWLEQIRKFGQGQRANLVSLKMSWNEQGEILTTADLERDRKRVPRACTLNHSKQAKCSVGAIRQ